MYDVLASNEANELTIGDGVCTKGRAHHVSGARHRVAIVVEASRQVRHRRVAVLPPTRNGVALQQADLVVVSDVV